MIEIRVFKKADTKGVVNLWKECFNYYSSPHNKPEKSISVKMKHKDGLFFVAVDAKGEVVGSVMAGFDGHRGWIYSMAVKQELRTKGLGSSLLKHAEKELKKRGAPKINLQVMPDNEGVIKFYEKNGYAVEPRISMGKKLIHKKNL
jgi:ribosomal protein S18 acetylase RimI-like enzyme